MAAEGDGCEGGGGAAGGGGAIAATGTCELDDGGGAQVDQHVEAEQHAEHPVVPVEVGVLELGEGQAYLQRAGGWGVWSA